MLEKDNNKELKKLIPLRRLTEEGPYSTAYLSLLVQRKKLKAKKVGRNYFTTREWFNNYLENHARDEKRELKKSISIKTNYFKKSSLAPDIKIVEIIKEPTIRKIEKVNELKSLEKEKIIISNLKNLETIDKEEVLDKVMPISKNIEKVIAIKKESKGWEDKFLLEEKKIKEELKIQNIEIRKYKKSFQHLIIKKHIVNIYKNLLSYFSLGLKKLDYLFLLIPEFLINLFEKLFSFKKLSYRNLAVTSLTILLSFISLILLIIPASSTYIKFVEYKKIAWQDPRLEQINKLIDNQFLNLSDEFIGSDQTEKIILSDKEAFYLKIASLTGRLITSSRAIEENFKNNLTILKNKISFNNFTLNFLANQFDSLKIIKENILAKVFNYGENKLAVLRKDLKSEKQSPDISGQVAGVSEALEPGIISTGKEDKVANKLLALVDQAASQSQQAIKTSKEASLKTIEKIAEEQENLSYSLGDKLAKLTLSGAEKIKGITKTGSKKLAQVSETIKETTEESKIISDNSKVVLKEELDRSVWSVSDLYVKVLDFLIPDSLKRHYVEIYKTEEQIASQCLPEAEATQIIKETIKVVTEKPSSQPAISQPAEISSPVVKESIIRKDKLIVLGNSELVGDLFVGGNARFDKQVTIIGGIDVIGGIFNSQGNVTIYGNLDVKDILTANNLRIIGWSEFMGPANMTSLSADSVLVRNYLVAQGDATIYGNLNIAGTMQAGHLLIDSLGIEGFGSAYGFSVGDYGFTASGDAYFQGNKTYLNSKHTYITGALSISKSLDLDVSDSQALTVGDGTTNTLVVNTADDTVTIAGNITVTGTQTYSGDMTLSGALSLSASSSTAVLAVTQSGSGDIINFSNSSSQVLTLDNNGNLGIGTSSPAARLAIAGEASSTAPLFLISTSSAAYATTTVFMIDSFGNVGIGTTTADERLAIDGRLQLGPLDAPVVTDDKLYNVGGNLFWDSLNLTGGGVLPAGTAGQTIYHTGANWQASSNLYNDGTNVGIGTTSPFSKLTLWGTGNLLELSNNASSTIFLVTDTGSTTIGSTIISPNASSLGDLLVSNGTSAYWQGTSTLGFAGSDIYENLTLNYLPKWNTTEFANSLIYDTGTNVGIGTTSPYSLFTIWGSNNLL
ncbi:MAG: hypothetical protein ABIG60_02230, partial [Patescibacteria group bacterium]